MNLYLKQESAAENKSKVNKLSHSMFNLYENRSVFPDNQVVEDSNDRSMMNLYLN